MTQLTIHVYTHVHNHNSSQFHNQIGLLQKCSDDGDDDLRNFRLRSPLFDATK